jgi:isoleucyl-tRNA synthetase
MSKHLGNVLEPIPLMDAHGADALRWFFAASGSPWGARRVGHDVLSEIVRKVLLTYWNTASFLVLYANAGGWTPSSAPPAASRPLLDRWVLSELHAVTRDVTSALESFDTAAAGRRLTTFIDDLSNWYVRRSRRRFWDGPGSADGAAAFATLYECVTTLTLLLAPFVPFVTDYVWGVLRRAGAPESVHLASWPAADASQVDPELPEQMALARRLVELGRSARSGASVRTRQPLRRALIGAAGFDGLPDELRSLIAAELNVASLSVLSGELVDYVVKPNFRALGRRYRRETPSVAAAIAAVPAADVAAAVLAGGSVSVPLPSGEEVTVGAGDVIVTQTPRAGWAVATDAGETVAIDTAITPELRREGLAREVIRLIQEARKSDGLDVTDRIVLRWSAGDPELAAALNEHAALVAGEVLAMEFGPAEADAPVPADAREHVDADLGLRFWLRRDRLFGGLLGLVREAGAAGGAASVPGGGESRLVQVAITHEADEDAAGIVIPGDARDHGYFHAGVRAGRCGFPGWLVRLGRDESQLGIGRRLSARARLGLARSGRRGGDRIVAPLPCTGHRCLAARGERGRGRGRRRPGSRWGFGGRQVAGPGRTGRD